MDSDEHLTRAAKLLYEVYGEEDDPDPRLADAAAHIQVATSLNIMRRTENESGVEDDAAEGEEATTDGGGNGGTVVKPARDFDYETLDIEGADDRPDKAGYGVPIKDSERERAEVVNPDTVQHHILGMLADNGKPMTSRELIDATGIKEGTISGAISRLYKHTYIDRERGPSRPQGGKIFQYYPTEWGIEQLRKLDDEGNTTDHAEGIESQTNNEDK